MLEYIKEEIEKEIESLNNKLFSYQRKKLSLETKLDIVNEFDSHKFKLNLAKSYMIMFIATSVILNISFLSITETNIGFNTMLSCSWFGAGLFTYKYLKNKIELKKHFSKCLTVCQIALDGGNRTEFLNSISKEKVNDKNLNPTLLNQVVEILINQRNVINYNIDKCEETINDNRNALKYIEDYEDSNEFFSSTACLIAKSSESFEDYIKLSKQYQMSSSIANNYFKETEPYLSLNYDNSLGETIQYTEKSKQLFKKL